MTYLGPLQKPLEVMAGRPYPDAVEISAQATIDGAQTRSEIDMSVRYEQELWRHEALSVGGIKRAIGAIRQVASNFWDELNEPSGEERVRLESTPPRTMNEQREER